MVIVSVSRSKGNYQGTDYDNIIFQCFADIPPKSLLAGNAVETLKVKSEDAIDCFGKSLKSIDWDSLIGAEILPVYNKYGQVVSFTISAEEAYTLPSSSDPSDPSDPSDLSDTDSSVSEKSDKKIK